MQRRPTASSGCSCGQQGGAVSICHHHAASGRRTLPCKPGRLQLHEVVPATLQTLLSYARPES